MRIDKTVGGQAPTFNIVCHEPGRQRARCRPVNVLLFRFRLENHNMRKFRRPVAPKFHVRTTYREGPRTPGSVP